MAVVPYTFANQAGQIPLSELDVNFANVKAFAETAGNVTGNIQANITAVGTLTALTVSGNIVAPVLVGNVIGNVTGSLTGNVTGNVVGNISGNYTVPGLNTQVLFNDNGFANAVAGLTYNKASNLLAVAGTVSAATINTAGNIQGSNLNITGSVSATGNITGGNITGSTIRGSNLNSTGSVSAAGNITGGNIIGAVLATTVSASGNITGGNILTSGIVSLSGNLTVGGNTALSGNSLAVTAANGTNNTQIATTAFVVNAITNSAIPAGVILLWSGSIASIPAGWALCDGGNGTPNLRDRFVVGAGSTYAVAATGGSANAVVVSHTHTATSSVSDPGHNHSNGVYNKLLTVSGAGTVGFTDTGSEPDVTQSGNILSNTTGITVSTTVASSGVSGTNANLPPYYALAYIMKL